VSYNAVQSALVVSSASTNSNICRMKLSLTADAIKKQLTQRNKASLALDGCTSLHTLAIMLGIACYINQNVAVHEVHLIIDYEYRLFSSYFES
jgi:hypothetical protein